MLKTFKIPEENITVLDKNLAKLNKAAVKLGVDQTTYKVLGEEMKTVRDDVNGDWYYKVLELEVSLGEIPKMEGWELVAAIDHDPVQGNFVRVAPGKTILSAYREADNGCDHCGHKRNRKSTYICHHEDGRSVKVGSTCIKDFLGHTSPELVVYSCDYLFGIESVFVEGGEFRGCYEESYFPLDSFMAFSVKCIREVGWVSKGAAYDTDAVPTINNIQMDFHPPVGFPVDRITYPTNADKKEALKVIEWAKTLSETNPSDYAHNASLIANAGFLKFNQEALAASLVASYQRFMEKEVEKSLANKIKETSDFFGEEKKRYEMNVTILNVRFLGENQFGGETTLVKFTDGSNLFSWFATNGPDMSVGDELVVKATVKKHNEFKGVKETMVNRVAVQ